MTTEWEARYRCIERYWSVFIPGGESTRSRKRVTLIVAGESFTFKVSSGDGSALLNVLHDKAPKAARVRGLRKYSALDFVNSMVTVALLVAVALGFLHHHSGGSTTLARPLGAVSAGACIDPLGQQARCGSTDATFVLARCSDPGTLDRDTMAQVAAVVPELKQVIQVAARKQLCLKPGP